MEAANNLRHRSGALILRNGLILLLYRKRHGEEYYVVPGGGVEPGENPTQTAIREIKEEAGVSIKTGELVGEFIDESRCQHLYYFACVLEEDKEPEWQEAHKQSKDNYYEFRWVGLAELKDIPLKPERIKPMVEALITRRFRTPLGGIPFLIQFLRKKIPEISSLYLYGSSVHGLRNEQSDIDLFVVMHTVNAQNLYSLRRAISELSTEGWNIGITVHSREEILIDERFPAETFIHRNRTWFFVQEMKDSSSLLWGEDIFSLLPTASRAILLQEAARVLKSLAYEARKKLVNKSQRLEDRIDIVKYALYGAQYFSCALGGSYVTVLEAAEYLRPYLAEPMLLRRLIGIKAAGFQLSEDEWETALSDSVDVLELFSSTATHNYYAISGARNVLLDGYGLLYEWPAGEYDRALRKWEAQHGIGELAKEEWLKVKQRGQIDAHFYDEWQKGRFGSSLQSFKEFDRLWILEHSYVLKGAPELLKRMRDQDRSIVLITDTVHSKGMIGSLLEKLGVSQFFSDVHVSSAMGSTKDDGGFFNAIVSRYLPSQSVFIGHDKQELASALACGYFLLGIGEGLPGITLSSYASDTLEDLPL